MENIRYYSQIQIRLFFSLLALALFIVYPNIYNENYLVYIQDISLEEFQEISQEKFPDWKLETEQTDLSVLFDDISDQLDAFETIKRMFPAKKVSLNIQTKAPDFWNSLGVHPMKLGLDLRGGVHFVLDVDLETAYKAYAQEQIYLMSTQLKEQGIPFKILSLEKEQDTFEILDLENFSKAFAHLVRYFPELTFSQKKKSQISYKISEQVLTERNEQILETTLTTMSSRINELGLSEATLYRAGQKQIVVDLPGIQDVHEAKRLLGKTATVEFYLSHSKNWRPGQALPLGSMIKKDHRGIKYPLSHRPILTGASIIDAQVGASQDGRPAVDLRISHEVLRQFKKITHDHQGWSMGVLFREVNYKEVWNEKEKNFDIIPQIEEKVISYATILSQLGERFQITGLSAEESAELALLLRSGSLPTSVKIVEEKTIGPSLGQDNIDGGVKALLIGSAAIFTFMIIFYGKFGLIANITLIFNLIFLLALLSLLQATLTLPGIAGIVLTIGMAVDANVLIFERIREEVEHGNKPWVAINLGFDRAMMTIFDSNLTTFVVGLILFTLGSGLIRGFAVTLCLGLMTSVYSALVGTKILIKIFFKNKSAPEIKFKKFHLL